MKNYYAILGVTRNATAEEIKAAYRTNAKKYHPDLNPNNTNYALRFREINEAYDILSDEKKRAEYNAELDGMRKSGSGGGTPPPRSGAGTPPPRSGGGTPPPQSATASIQEQINKYQQEMQRQFQQQLQQQLQQQQNQYMEQMQQLNKQYADQIATLRKQFSDKLEQAARDHQIQLDREERAHDEELQEAKKVEYERGYQQGAFDARKAARLTTDDLNAKVAELTRQLDAARTAGAAFGSAPAPDTSTPLTRQLAGDLSKANIELRQLRDQVADLTRQLGVSQKALADQKARYDKLNDAHRELIVKANTQNDDSEKDAQIDALNEELLYWQDYSQQWEEYCDALEYGMVRPEEEDEIQVRKYENQQRRQAKGTHYATLKLFLTALPEEIEEAYRKLEKRYRNRPKFVDQYNAVRYAYSVLSDARLKAEYDEASGNYSVSEEL